MFCSGNSDSTFAASYTDSGSEMVIFPYYEGNFYCALLLVVQKVKNTRDFPFISPYVFCFIEALVEQQTTM